jgi:hypothetical protein
MLFQVFYCRTSQSGGARFPIFCSVLSLLNNTIFCTRARPSAEGLTVLQVKELNPSRGARFHEKVLHGGVIVNDWAFYLISVTT